MEPQQPQSVPPASPNFESQSYSQMMQNQKRHVPKWLAVIVVIIVVIAGLFGGLYVFANQATAGAVKVSNEFIADLQSNDPGAAYALFAPAGKQAEAEAKLVPVFTELSPESHGTVKITGKMVYKQSGQPSTANVVYLIGSSNGGYLKISLQDNSSWQILGFEVSNTPLSASAQP